MTVRAGLVTSAGTNSSSTISVRTLDQSGLAAWDAFVQSAPGGLPLHLSGWRQVMHETYGYQMRYLVAESSGQVRAVLPMFIVPSRLTGRRLMTMPGGMCATDKEAAFTLLDRASEIAEEEGLKSVVMQDSRVAWSSGWHTESNHVFWLLRLPDSEEALWSQLDGNIRRQVRIARKNGLRAQVDRNGKLLRPFYNMFSRFTHQMGTPVFHYRFLENIIRVFPDGFNIVLIWQKETPVAGYFQLEMGETMYGMWGAALPQSLGLRSAYLALWEIMSDAVNSGFANLDMGRSPADSNVSKFKGQWGGESSPIYQLSRREKGWREEGTFTNQVQSDQKFQLFTRIWPKLPLAATTRLGPKLRWHIPFA